MKCPYKLKKMSSLKTDTEKLFLLKLIILQNMHLILLVYLESSLVTNSFKRLL